MRNFFQKTLYQRRFLALWWFVGIAFVTFVTVSVYDSFKATDVEQLLESLPPAVQNLAGDVSSFKTVEGYLVQQIYSLRLPLLTIILSISLLTAITAGDEQRGLLETQLSLPVSRTRLLLQKLAAALVIIAVATTGAVAGIAVGFGMLQETFNLWHVLQFTINCLAVAVLYGMVAFMLASVTGRRALSLGVASGFAFVSYLIDSMSASVSSLEAINKLTFFHYYQNDPFSWKNFLFLIACIVLLITISVVGFNKRDVKSN